MVDATQDTQDLADHVKRNFEALTTDQQKRTTALIECAAEEVHSTSKSTLKHLVDQIFDRGWDGPVTHIGSDRSWPTNSIDGIKNVVSAEIIGTIQGDKEWCRRYRITPEGLVAPPLPHHPTNALVGEERNHFVAIVLSRGRRHIWRKSVY